MIIMYNRVTNQLLDKIISIVGNNEVIIDERIKEYAHDMTEDYNFPPEVVVKPQNTSQISEILKLANEEKIPVTPIGARTGLSGGMLCVYGGIGLSLEKLNQIIEIDNDNLQATVEPGVITQFLQNEVEKLGLYYPPDPSSKGSCFIGGNVAENAGGLHAVKYGTTKDYILNLEVVLPNGEIIQTGANTLKNSTGYHLTQLLVGSEGTLGIITKITLKLIPLPKYRLLLKANFTSPYDACKAVSQIFQNNVLPSALEFMEKDAIDFGQKYLHSLIEDTQNIGAQLLIEVDGNHLDNLYQDIEKIYEVLLKFNLLGEPILADTYEKQEEIWKLRRCLGHAVKGTTIYKEEDTVVPRAKLADLLAFVKNIGKEYGFQSVCYGHAGDGNLHVNIIKNDLDDKTWKETIPFYAIPKIFEFTKKLGGTISGEHGIGWVQKNYMPIMFNKTHLDLFKGIKRLFDPNHILNPGKILPN